MATAGRGGSGSGEPRRRKTPKGRFWMGKCDPGATSTNDLSGDRDPSAIADSSLSRVVSCRVVARRAVTS
jgi:hypothetical protein